MFSKIVLGLGLALPLGLAAGLARPDIALCDPSGTATPATSAAPDKAVATPMAPPKPAALKPAASAPATSAAPDANAAPFVPMDSAVAIQKANDYFNGPRTMIGDFVQISGDRRSEGKIYIQKPGKLRFEYADPATLDIIADGSDRRGDRPQAGYPGFLFHLANAVEISAQGQDRPRQGRDCARCDERPGQGRRSRSSTSRPSAALRGSS